MSKGINYNITGESLVVLVPSRKEYFFNVILAIAFIVFSCKAFVTIIPVWWQESSPVIGLLIFSLFQLFFLYMGFTALSALLWTLFGKERIIVSKNTVEVTKMLFVAVWHKKYEIDKINGLYSDAYDFNRNKISWGRNDFLSAFKIGTIHFTYNGKLVHLAGGMNDADGVGFLEKLKYLGIPDKHFLTTKTE